MDSLSLSPVIVISTTQLIVRERERMLCPRLGDSFTRTIRVEEIMEVREREREKEREREEIILIP